MGYLLDTHCWLWLQTEPERFPDPLLNRLADRAVDLFLSAASAWEIGIKHATGRLVLPEPAAVYVPQGMGRTGTRELPVSYAHALAAADLPPYHRDPFDRLLVAQSRIEGLPLVTADRAIERYEVETIRVCRR